MLCPLKRLSEQVERWGRRQWDLVQLYSFILTIHLCSSLSCELLAVFLRTLIKSDVHSSCVFKNEHFLQSCCHGHSHKCYFGCLSESIDVPPLSCFIAVSISFCFLQSLFLDLGSVYFFLSLHFSSPFKCCKPQELMQAAHRMILILGD